MEKEIYTEELLQIIESASVLKMLALSDEENSPECREFLDSLAENMYDLAYTVALRQETYEKEDNCRCSEKECVKAENPSGLIIAIGLSEMDKKQMGRNFTYLAMNPYPDAIPKESKTYLVKTAQDKYNLMYYNKVRGTWANPDDDYFDCPEGYICAWLELI